MLFPQPRWELTGVSAPSADAIDSGDFDRDGIADLVAIAGEGIDVVRGFGFGHFASALHFDLGVSISSLAVGDFDADGVEDVASGSDATSLVFVSMGDASTVLQAPVVAPVFGRVRALDVADFDRDGALDLIAAGEAPNGVTVLWNSGNGSLGQPTSLPASAPASSVATGDWNGDGWIDLAVGLEGYGDVQVWLGAPQRVFAAGASFAAGGEVNEIEAGDFDENGVVDLALLVDCSSRVRTVAGDGNGAFVAPRDVPSGGAGCEGDFEVADEDGDGHEDIVVSPGWSDAKTIALRGDGLRQFTIGPTLAFTGAPSLLWRDLDGDGDSDLALWLGGDIEIELDHGSGLVTPPSFTTGVPWAMDLDAADLDQDGLPDLVLSVDTLSGHGGTYISTFRNVGQGHFAPAVSESFPGTAWILCALHDLDGDGDPDRIHSDWSGSLGVSLAGPGIGFDSPTFYALPPGVIGFRGADFDGDGDVDLASISSSSTMLSVMSGDGQGGFAPTAGFDLGAWPDSMAIGDVDGDLDIDVVVGAPSTHPLRIAVNDGAGAFSSVALHQPGVRFAPSAVLDWTGDGRADLIGTAWPLNAEPQRVWLLRATQTGGYGPAELISGGGSIGLEIADLDGDGYEDFIATDWIDDLALRFGSEEGAVASERHHGGVRRGVHTVADFDADGRLDIAAAGQSRWRAIVLLHDRALPGFYCEPTGSASGCAARVRADGCACASGSDPFVLRAESVAQGTSGGFVYGFGRASFAFTGATLCVQPPLRRIASQATGGRPLSPCSGALTVDFGELIRSGADPALAAGTEVHAQAWFLDSGSAVRLAASDAVEFTLLP